MQPAALDDGVAALFERGKQRFLFAREKLGTALVALDHATIVW